MIRPVQTRNVSPDFVGRSKTFVEEIIILRRSSCSPAVVQMFREVFAPLFIMIIEGFRLMERNGMSLMRVDSIPFSVTITPNYMGGRVTMLNASFSPAKQEKYGAV